VHRPLQKVDTEFLDNACLIMDEVQNLLNPLPTQKEEHSYLEKFLQKDDKPKLNLSFSAVDRLPYYVDRSAILL
jgi:hypothetical protein